MENKVTTVLTDKVAAFKLIARDALRMNLIVPRLSVITGLENDVKSFNDDIATINKEIDVETYEIGVLDVNHPNYSVRKESKEKKIADKKDLIAEITKHLEVCNKAIEEQKNGIAKIEAGETKVSLDALNDLVATLIKQDAIAQIKA